jgi:hypothetical protein
MLKDLGVTERSATTVYWIFPCLKQQVRQGGKR